MSTRQPLWLEQLPPRLAAALKLAVSLIIAYVTADHRVWNATPRPWVLFYLALLVLPAVLLARLPGRLTPRQFLLVLGTAALILKGAAIRLSQGERQAPIEQTGRNRVSCHPDRRCLYGRDGDSILSWGCNIEELHPESRRPPTGAWEHLTSIGIQKCKIDGFPRMRGWIDHRNSGYFGCRDLVRNKVRCGTVGCYAAADRALPFCEGNAVSHHKSS